MTWQLHDLHSSPHCSFRHLKHHNIDGGVLRSESCSCRNRTLKTTKVLFLATQMQIARCVFLPTHERSFRLLFYVLKLMLGSLVRFYSTTLRYVRETTFAKHNKPRCARGQLSQTTSFLFFCELLNLSTEIPGMTPGSYGQFSRNNMWPEYSVL